MRFNGCWLVLPVFVLLLSCNETQPPSAPPEMPMQEVEKSLETTNKKAVQTEDQRIDDFIQRYKWPVTKTPTGLRYWIYKQGTGEAATFGKTVTLNYETRLLTNALIYSSKEDGPKEFKVGSGGVEAGLEEVILLLRVGDKAKLVLPSYLAFGNTGDNDRITAKVSLVYDIELIKVQ